MASGKSRLGKRLAPKINYSFIDLDEFIVETQQKSISEIFNELGEVGFREIERDALHKASKDKNGLISCGGGTPCFYDNAEFMNSVGFTIYLDVDEDVLLDRLWRNRSTRPLIAEMANEAKLKQFVEKQLNERMQYYSLAKAEYNNTYPKGSLTDLIERLPL